MCLPLGKFIRAPQRLGLTATGAAWRPAAETPQLRQAGSQHLTQSARSMLAFRCQEHCQVSGTPEEFRWVLAEGLQTTLRSGCEAPHPRRPGGGRQVASRARRALPQPALPAASDHREFYFISPAPPRSCAASRKQAFVWQRTSGPGEAALPAQMAVGLRLSVLRARYSDKSLLHKAACLSKHHVY